MGRPPCTQFWELPCSPGLGVTCGEITRDLAETPERFGRKVSDLLLALQTPMATCPPCHCPELCQPTCLKLVPLEVKQKDDCKYVCYPIIRGPRGHPGEEGCEGPPGSETILINKTSFVDQFFGGIGVPEDPRQPYPDVQSAISGIPTGESFWQIFIWPGDYANTSTISPPAGTSLSIRGSGTGSAIVRAPIENTDLNSTVVEVANIRQLVGTETLSPNLHIDNAGSLRVRDSIIERDEGVTDPNGNPAVFSSGGSASGTLSMFDGIVEYASAQDNNVLASITNGNFRASGNRFSMDPISANPNTTSAIVKYRPSVDGGRVIVSDNIIGFTILNSNILTLYSLAGGNGTLPKVRMVLNDNHHTIRTGTPPVTGPIIYQQTNSNGLILARNNEYTFSGFIDEGELTPVTSIVGESPVKVVDDTLVNRKPLDPTDSDAQVNPGGNYQYQFNTGNALATNQGIQLATRQVIDPDSATTLNVTDDDFFVRIDSTSTIDTVNLPPASGSYRGKLVVIRNERAATNIAIKIDGMATALTVPAQTTRELINDGSSTWFIIGDFP